MVSDKGNDERGREVMKHERIGDLNIGCVLLAVVLLALGCGSATNTNRTNGTAGVSNVNTAASPSPSPEAATKSNIVFIVDSSGSMKAKAGAKTKMDAAKEVVSALIDQLPKDVQAGLMAYGHRQPKDCKDIELLVPVGPVQADVFKQKVAGLQPLGETPISASIRQAAEALKPLSGRKAIILISDGEETCHEDPCAIAAELTNADVDLQIHVVGFGIDTAAAKKQLHCIADATGGMYKDAANAEELKKNLEGIASEATTKGSHGRLVTLSKDSNGKELRYLAGFYRPGTNDKLTSTDIGLVQDYSIDWQPLVLSPGVYDVKYSGSELPDIWRRSVEIKAGEDTVVDLGQFGRVRFALTDENGKSIGMEVYIYESGQNDHSFGSCYPGTKPELPSGTYDFRLWDSEHADVWQRGVVVRPGEETVVEAAVHKR